MRERYRRLRSDISSTERKSAAEAAAEILSVQPAFLSSKQIACYLPYKSEFDTYPVMQTIWRMAKTCYLPVLRAGELLFSPYQHGDELKKNQFDIPEPVDHTNQIDADKLDLVLLPLIAFDGVGYRLGTGGGYYDKTFAFRKKSSKAVPLLVGLGYDCQRAAPLPADPWDIMLDAVLTEKDWHRFS